MKREGIHLAMIQETKLGLRDATPGIRGYVAYRKDREGSGTTKPRAGGLCTYVAEELPHWAKTINTNGIFEAQAVVIATQRRFKKI